MKYLHTLVLLLLMTTVVLGKEKQKIIPSAYMEGIFVRNQEVPTGDFTCTQNGNTSNCTPDSVSVYIVDLGSERLPVVSVYSKKAIALGLATMGRSVMMGKKSVLWNMQNGQHFQYRLEGSNIRIQGENRDSVYEIYLKSHVELYP